MPSSVKETGSKAASASHTDPPLDCRLEKNIAPGPRSLAGEAVATVIKSNTFLESMGQR